MLFRKQGLIERERIKMKESVNSLRKLKGKTLEGLALARRATSPSENGVKEGKTSEEKKRLRHEIGRFRSLRRIASIFSVKQE